MFRTIILVLFPMLAFSQSRGVVVDAESGLPVSYANIFLDEKHWVSAEENGKFEIAAKPEDVLSFSAIGYETVKITASEAAKVGLKPSVYKLKNVDIVKPKRLIEQSLGGYKKGDIDAHYGCLGTPGMVARYFAPDGKMNATPHLKTLVVRTKSDIKNAKFNVHFLAVEDGKPGREIGEGNIIGVAKKGKNDTEIDLTPYHLQFPEEGFFVALEWLVIPENKNELTFTDRSGKSYKQTQYEPTFATTRTEINTSWGDMHGRGWGEFKKVTPEKVAQFNDDFKKATGEDAPPFDYRYSEFAMKLIMTN